MLDALSYFSFQPVLHDYHKGCGMCYPVCGIVYIKDPMLVVVLCVFSTYLLISLFPVPAQTCLLLAVGTSSTVPIPTHRCWRGRLLGGPAWTSPTKTYEVTTSRTKSRATTTPASSPSWLVRRRGHRSRGQRSRGQRSQGLTLAVARNVLLNTIVRVIKL